MKKRGNLFWYEREREEKSVACDALTAAIRWDRTRSREMRREKQQIRFLGSEFVCLSIDQYACDKYV